MPSFSRPSFAFALLTSICTCAAHLSTRHLTHATTSTIQGGQSVHAYHPRATFETFGTDGLEHRLSKRGNMSFTSLAGIFLSDRVGLDSSNFDVRSSFSNGPSKVVYFQQRLNGLKVANAVANVAINDANNIASFGSNFMEKPERVASPTPEIALADAVSTMQNNFGGIPNGVSSLEYFMKDNGDAVLTHIVQVEKDGRLFEVFVNAHDGKIVASNDFTADATYRAIPIGSKDATSGFQLISDPERVDISSLGWAINGTTAGNNVIVFKGDESQVANETSNGVFDYAWDATANPDTPTNLAAAKVNAFYVLNAFHDIAYLYGFTEQNFNFQQDNTGKGGESGDRVEIFVQDAGFNNANFVTPPDGQSGQMRIFLFNNTTPFRDAALSNDVIVHEATHGLTNRLTGGGTGRCLQTDQSRGLGEGWSDAFADWMEQKIGPIRDFSLANWVLGQDSTGPGIRTRPYSTSKDVNNSAYSDVGTANTPHRMGEVWANILHNIHAALVDAEGFDPDALKAPNGSAGNIKYMHLFIDHLSLQPCNPSFVNARDAWLQADANRYQGAHKCMFWKVFASRGLGLNAKDTSPIQDEWTVPEECR